MKALLRVVRHVGLSMCRSDSTRRGVRPWFSLSANISFQVGVRPWFSLSANISFSSLKKIGTYLNIIETDQTLCDATPGLGLQWLWI